MHRLQDPGRDQGKADPRLDQTYTGRFAPSPTGPLHFGSLVAALASYLDARHVNGKWLLRIEDLDPPRESTTAPDEIRHQLEAHGLNWDGDILFQSTRLAAYDAALEKLANAGRIYVCRCSRKSFGAVYPGRCRDAGYHPGDVPFAYRFRVADRTLSFTDRFSGPHAWHLTREVGDFIVKRKDGLFAYQLAVVVDDAFQGVTDVVRGNDLLDSTPRQLELAHALDLPTVTYGHIPVITGDDGAKLSKQSHAHPIDSSHSLQNLIAALKALGQPIPDDAGSSTTEALLTHAVTHWSPDLIPGVTDIALSTLPTQQ